MMISFRNMELSDIEAIMQIEKSVYQTAWSKTAFVNELKHNKYASYYVLEDNNSIVAYGGIWNVLDEAHLTNIAVRKKFQSKGYGRKMLGFLEKKAYEKGALSMTLEVRASNKLAQALYEKCGYKSFGSRPNYYTDNNEDAVIMWKLDLGVDY